MKEKYPIILLHDNVMNTYTYHDSWWWIL